jgi:hypothetical protein
MAATKLYFKQMETSAFTKIPLTLIKLGGKLEQTGRIPTEHASRLMEILLSTAKILLYGKARLEVELPRITLCICKMMETL